MQGKRILVTSGPTHEPIDPVRYIANRSSGAQGTAVARALGGAWGGCGLCHRPGRCAARPSGVQVVRVETAQEMSDAVDAALPVDAGVFAAAVADWRVASASDRKLKKTRDGLPALEFAENPDILKRVAHLEQGRPALVVGFAAETEMTFWTTPPRNDCVSNVTGLSPTMSAPRPVSWAGPRTRWF